MNESDHHDHPPARPLLVAELFAGAGGAALGLEAAGLRHVALVERDPDAAATLRAVFGDAVVIEADVREVTLPRHDVLWASPPCQPHSRAGKRLGAADPRDLVPWTLDHIACTRPRWCVIENVAGAPEPAMVDALVAVGCAVTSLFIDSADHGAPQHRKRHFVVGGPRPVAPPVPTHGPTTWVTLADALPHLDLPLGAHEAACTTLEHPDWWYRMTRPSEPARTVGTKGNTYAWVKAPEYGQADHWVRDGATDEVVYLSRPYSRAGTERWRLHRPSPTGTTAEVKGTRASAASGWTFNGGPDRAADAVFLAVGRRRLTIAEVLTLMGMPPNYPLVGNKESRYKQAGNAVIPVVAEAIGRAILDAERAAP